MKEIRLITQKMENFMGITDLVFAPQGHNATIRGDNGTFKTTNASAFSWLLFDKDIHGNSTGNFSIKTADENDEIIPNIDHSVTDTMDIDGVPLTLQKIYKEKWLKKRKVLTGHTVEYLVDEVPVLKKDYDKRISEIIPENLFRLLTSITYFNSMKWEARRKILFQLCAGLTEDALEDAEKKKKILASKKRTINEKKDGIQPRIDEKNRDLATIAGYNQAEIQARIASLDKQIQDIKTDSTRVTLLKEQAELEARLSQIKVGQEKKQQEASSGIRAEIEDVENDYAKTRDIISNMEFEIGQQVRLIADAKTEIKDLRQKFDERVINQDTGIQDVCPACGQDIPQNQRDASLAKFNQQKSEQLERINRDGKKAVGFKEKAETKKGGLEADLKLEKADIIKIKKDLEKKKFELEKKQQAVKPISEEVKEAAARIADIEDLLGQQDQQQDTRILETELTTERTKMAKIDAGKDHKARIAELGKQEKSLCAEIEKLEADLFKAEENIQEQARLLEVPINAKFGLVKFQLFEKQMNEGVRPTCVTLINGIPYGHGLNKGNEINAGLDIIRTLSQHYQIQAPVFIDNCESISYPIDPGCQCFKLIKVKDMEKIEIAVDE